MPKPRAILIEFLPILPVPIIPIVFPYKSKPCKSKIEKSDFGDANKDAVLQPIKTLLGKDGDSRGWRYLNQGTHDEADRPDFDRSSVEQIISALEQIDEAIGSCGAD